VGRGWGVDLSGAGTPRWAPLPASFFKHHLIQSRVPLYAPYLHVTPYNALLVYGTMSLMITQTHKTLSPMERIIEIDRLITNLMRERAKLAAAAQAELMKVGDTIRKRKNHK
jgi:hypothetical protein